MKHKSILLVLACIPLLMGQMCGAPTPNQPENGIIPGKYKGLLTGTATIKWLSSGETNTYPILLPLTLVISENGMPTTSEGIDLSHEIAYEQHIANISIKAAITEMTIVKNRVDIASSAEVTFSFPDTTQEDLLGTGTMTASYHVKNGKLNHNAEAVVDSDAAQLTIKYSFLGTRQ